MKLNLDLETLAQVVGGDLHGRPSSFTIENIASLEHAGPHDLAIIIDRGDASVFDAIKPETIAQSSAGIFLAAQPLVDEKNYVLVKDPLEAFEKLVAHVNNTQPADEFEIKSGAYISTHATIGQGATAAPGAHISAHATIGTNTKIGSQVFIGKHCSIGNNVILHPGVKVMDECCIGDNTIIHANTVVGSDGFGYSVTKMGMRKIPQVGNVTIGRFVEIGANCSIDRASFGKTIIEDGVKIDNNVHLAHNVKIGMGSAILALTGIAGSAQVGRGCQIGGQVAIKNGVKIGDGAKIVSKAAIMNNVKEKETMCGIPAMQFSQWKRMMVVMTKLPDMFKRFRKVSNMVDAYEKKSWWQRLFS